MILIFFEQNKLQMILSNFFEDLTCASGNYAAQNRVSESINGQLWFILSAIQAQGLNKMSHIVINFCESEDDSKVFIFEQL